MLAVISVVAEVIGIAMLVGYVYAAIQGSRKPVRHAEGS
jgi:DNA-binding transcriptional regulator GbsR (MarR family)